MKCVDWFGEYKESDLIERFFATASVMTPDVAPKYQNTVKFFRHVRKVEASKGAKTTSRIP